MCCDLCNVQKDAPAMQSPLAKSIKCCKNMQEHDEPEMIYLRRATTTCFPPDDLQAMKHHGHCMCCVPLLLFTACAQNAQSRTQAQKKDDPRARRARAHTMQIGKSKAELDCASFLVGMAMRTGIPISVFMTTSADAPASLANSDFSSKVQPPRNTTRHCPARLCAGRGRRGARGPFAFLASISAFAAS